ncbi:MAG: hypothetical protein GXP63_04230 [DPANN group archaeon]|nr:hypothetical protein [DPANN group archaeon]
MEDDNPSAFYDQGNQGNSRNQGNRPSADVSLPDRLAAGLADVIGKEAPSSVDGAPALHDLLSEGSATTMEPSDRYPAHHPTHHPDRYDYEHFDSRTFWDHFNHSAEYASVRQSIARKSAKLLNRELLEKTVLATSSSAASSVDRVDDAFKGLRMSFPALEKLIYGTRRVNELLGYKSEIRFDLVSDRASSERDPALSLVSDVHITYGQKASPSSVYSTHGRDPYLFEILRHHKQRRAAMAHSHGPHPPFHSFRDDEVLRTQLDINPLKKTILLEDYFVHPVPIAISYLPSLVVNDGTAVRLGKEQDSDYHVTVGVKMPFFTGQGRTLERVHLNRDRKLTIISDDACRSSPSYDPDLITSQILDRVEVETAPGLFERMVKFYAKKTNLSERMLLMPLQGEPDFRQRTIDRRNRFYRQRLKETLTRKRRKLQSQNIGYSPAEADSDGSAVYGRNSPEAAGDSSLEERVSPLPRQGFFSRLKKRAKAFWNGQRYSVWQEPEVRDALRDIKKALRNR